MNYPNDFASILQQLQYTLHVQNEKTIHLETMIKDLQTELEDLKQKKFYTIERIEYKFDQLKIEQLDGTLNIGITPTDLGEDAASIEEFAVKENRLEVPVANEQTTYLFERIQKAIHHYLHDDCIKHITATEQRLQQELDEAHRHFIVDDIQKQVDQRIKHYLAKAPFANNDPHVLHEIEGATLTYVRNDIEQTIDEYFKHLPKKGV